MPGFRARPGRDAGTLEPPITPIYVTITYNHVMGAANPFVYGEVVTAAAFADRDEERARLARDLGEGQKVFLISPRRYGKSSLIRGVMKALAGGGVLTVEVTVAASSSYVAFLEAYARALLLAADTPAAGLRRWAAELLKGLRPELRFDAAATGRPRFEVTFPAVRSPRDAARLAPEIFALPGRIADSRRQPMAIALDEFQTIAAFDGGNVEHALRAAVQEQRSVGYVFAGSEPSLMERMLTPRRPFYKAGPVIRLGKIDERLFAAFLESKFEKSGIRPEDGLGAAIVDLAGNVPYDVQRLAHEAWDDVRAAGRRTAGLEDLHLTLAQRAVLRAIVLEEGRELLSAGVRLRHRLPAASSVQAALTALVKQDIVMKDAGRYVVNDSLYREWMARRTV